MKVIVFSVQELHLSVDQLQQSANDKYFRANYQHVPIAGFGNLSGRTFPETLLGTFRQELITLSQTFLETFPGAFPNHSRKPFRGTFLEVDPSVTVLEQVQIRKLNVASAWTRYCWHAVSESSPLDVVCF